MARRSWSADQSREGKIVSETITINQEPTDVLRLGGLLVWSGCILFAIAASWDFIELPGSRPITTYDRGGSTIGTLVVLGVIFVLMIAYWKYYTRWVYKVLIWGTSIWSIGQLLTLVGWWIAPGRMLKGLVDGSSTMSASQEAFYSQLAVEADFGIGAHISLTIALLALLAGVFLVAAAETERQEVIEGNAETEDS